MGCLVSENQGLALVAYPNRGAVVLCWAGAFTPCQWRSDTCRNHFSACSGSGSLKELGGPGDPLGSRCVAKGGTTAGVLAAMVVQWTLKHGSARAASRRGHVSTVPACQQPRLVLN